MGIVTTDSGQIYNHSLVLDDDTVFPSKLGSFADLDFLFSKSGGKYISRMERAEAEKLFCVLEGLEGCVLDIGTRHAGSAIVLATSMPFADIISVDIASDIPSELAAFMAQTSIARRVHFMDRSSRIPFDDRDFAAVVFDGDHTRQGIAADIKAHWNSILPNGYAVFHDVDTRVFGAPEVGSPRERNEFQIAITPVVEKLVDGQFAMVEAFQGDLVILVKLKDIPDAEFSVLDDMKEKTLIRDVAETAAAKEVWDKKTHEEAVQDNSHYRGVGRWADDALWRSVGERSLATVNQMLQVYCLGAGYWTKARTVLEWGPGGGSNPFAFRNFVPTYYGVDISQSNLDEADRILRAENCDLFQKVYLRESLTEVTDAVKHPIDVFLSTAVFQHFPSQQYGVDVLRCVRELMADDAIGFVQIRFANRNPKFEGIKDLKDYRAHHITANSYGLDEFYDILKEAGFRGIYIEDVSTASNYATFCFRV